MQVQVSFSWLFCYLQVFGEIYSSQLLTRQCNSSSEKQKNKNENKSSNKRTKSLGHHATTIESCQDLRRVQLTVFWNKNEWNEVVQILPHERFATILLGIPILDTNNWTDPWSKEKTIKTQNELFDKKINKQIVHFRPKRPTWPMLISVSPAWSTPLISHWY